MRLIDADALNLVHFRDKDGELAFYAQELMEAPTIDAVPVIRCKACGHSFWLTDERGRRMLCCTEIGKRGLQEDSFCSFGKVSDV